jgi:hypothetical protein
MEQVRSWLSALLFGDPLEQRQALRLQVLILTLVGAVVLDLGAILITSAPGQSRLLLMAVVLFVIVMGLVGVFLDRLNSALREALTAAHLREHQLNCLRLTLGLPFQAVHTFRDLQAALTHSHEH